MNTAQRISSYLVAGAIAAALLFYAFGKVDGWLSRGDRETTAQSAALLELVKAHARFRAKMAAAAKRQSVAAAAAHDSANALRLGIAHLPVDERPARILVQIASRDSSAYAKCSVVVIDCERRASLAEADNRQLSDQLARQMKVKDHRCGIFAGYGVVAYNDSTAHARFAWQVGVGCRLSRLPLLP